MYKVWRTLLVAAFIATGIFFARAQKAPEKNWNSARILHEIKKMKHVGRILYIAAHPDDENTQLISYLVNDLGLETAYLSLTRGDGGQDLLGPEVREELGVIRTQELLMARSIDGGQQFFTRANDFGFSKTAAETFHIWDSNQVLSDIVWVIRKFKPDLIITRFSPTYTKTHGHHQASAILATEAFTAAADPKRFPEQLKYVDTWQAQGLYWNTSFWFYQENKFDTAGLYHTSIGDYMPLLGKSVGELAAESRSMHKSQGFGVAAKRGNIDEYFVYMKGEKPTGRDIFSDYDWNWKRIKGCEKVGAELDTIVAQFNCENPSKSFLSFWRILGELKSNASNYLVADKLKQLDDIMLQCNGIYTEAISNKEYLPVGDSINVLLNLIRQSNDPEVATRVKAELRIDGNKICSIPIDSLQSLTFNHAVTFKAGSLVTQNTNITGPYWLENPPTVGMYKVDNQLLRGLPQNPTQVTLHVKYKFDFLLGKMAFNPYVIEKDIPVFYKNTDPVKGEMYSLACIVPPAVANPENKLMIFANNNSKDLNVKIKSFEKGKVMVRINAPAGWKVEPVTKEIDMQGDGLETPLTFSVTPPDNAQTANLEITIDCGGYKYNRSLEEISYDHIPKQILLPKSTVKVAKMDIKTSDKLIGYINGAGDDIPEMLREIGYKVEMIPVEQLSTINLQKYDAIIAGVRAYNTDARLKYDNARLLDYVKNGGNYIVQYNNNFRLVNDNIGPYPLTLSSDRTTEEDSKVTFVHPDNPALNTPNKITAADFDGWVQERGLYYPNKWDTLNYTPLLQMGDNGEKPTQGALLVAKYGKGNFVYTGLSFFRELPAGVPGAFRLFANLIELSKHE